MTKSTEYDLSVLRIDNAERLREQIEATYLDCVDRIVEKFAAELGADTAQMYRSFLPGGQHAKLAQYVYAIIHDSLYAVVKSAAKDEPTIRDAVILPSYDRWFA